MSSPNEGGLKLLVVVAHPHDVCHMGGTCAHHVDRGDHVSVVALTGGQRTHNEKLADELRKPPARRDRNVVDGSRESYAKRKTREFVRACAVFGITDVTVLPFSDHPFEVTDDVVSALAEILYDVRPQMILTHAPYTLPDRRCHYAWVNDHTAAGIAVQKALNHVSIPDTERGRAPHRVASIYYTGVDYGFHEVDVCIDISDQVHKRIEAETIFESRGTRRNSRESGSSPAPDFRGGRPTSATPRPSSAGTGRFHGVYPSPRRTSGSRRVHTRSACAGLPAKARHDGEQAVS